ncbi:hypothetical protein [Methylobacterium durans]|uniref:Uncharacterized protein n=1 Tax=Methylobacterium durans TaxID=2202825 RepID=A0A2U8WGA5_9HYPH|nr:hypothetical protein [Methylobacterium durans]AWN44551.1 hypothetical protein DK389_13795 [Methylobacterium durans]
MPDRPFPAGDESASAAARAAARCLEAREAIGQVGDPTLQALFDLLLLQIGRNLAKELQGEPQIALK